MMDGIEWISASNGDNLLLLLLCKFYIEIRGSDRQRHRRFCLEDMYVECMPLTPSRRRSLRCHPFRKRPPL